MKVLEKLEVLIKKIRAEQPQTTTEQPANPNYLNDVRKMADELIEEKIGELMSSD